MTEPDGGAILYEDEDSFRAQRRQAAEDCVAEFRVASALVDGSEARLRPVIKALRALDAFAKEVERLTAQRGFAALPEFKRGTERFDGYHQLTEAPWRGIFLVSRDGGQVVGLVFSRHPHKLEERLGEIAQGYRHIRSDEPEKGKSDDD
ncbi:hypothetical protein [Citromicrobium sp. WPS32]|uniref:hypothetical protein n=1 Tax=Citromicrobium sp. WPS32 TaxID=1634517 RepID=UPI0006C8EDE4|nr:hypothetical protein [Citromicrobium sp. WPS32]KPM12508.1 hypothetical protein WG75_14200 [Citromicrobium sp. WPS32]MAY76205.1 hypothetical protein [Citromicrobium sp.]